MTESVVSGEILSSNYGLKLGSNELFVTCLSSNINILEKPIKNYSDIFSNTSLNHTSIRYSLVSQPKNKFILNSEQ